MPPANTPSDTPSLSPHRRSDTLPRVAELDARNFQTIVRYPLPLIDESLRLRTSGQPLNRSHRHDPAGTSGLDGGRSRRPGASRPRRNSRDQDLRHPREHAYGPRIPLVRPGERQSVYDWAPVPAPVPPASAPGIDDDLTSRSLPPPFDHEEYLARYFPFMSRDFSAMFEAGGFRLPGDAPRSQQPDLFGGIFTTGSDGGGASNSSSSSVTTTSSSATAPASARITHPRRRSRVYWPEPAMSSSRDHQDRDRMMDDAEWDGSDTMLLSRLSRARYAYERLSDSRLPEASKEVEKAIEYLAKVRGCRTTRESISLVVRLGFYSEDDWERLLDEHPNFDDFVSDTSFLRVAETSWLEAGGIFWGSQIAPAMSPVHDTSSTRSNASSSGSTSSQWTVKLSISSIDYWQLRLTGTMEAFTDAKTNIKTYFEGEIIDFNGHTFQTFTFASTLADDANNWRKLDPFVDLTNKELVKSLVSRKFMKELNEQWLFLRIKELDFISPVPEVDVGGLTIGGFYYLSLRRDDGRIQGYYYDSQSQPFQELTLMPSKRLFPSYQFR